MSRQILIVDDEINILNALERLLLEDDYRILRASSGADGLALLDQHPGVGVILADQRMPQMTGIDFLRQVKNRHPRIVRMILSGYSELQTLTEAINEGSIFKFVCKPWDDSQLLRLVGEAFDFHELTEHNRRLSESLIDSNRQLEQLNEELERRVDEKTRHLQLHIASLAMHQEAIEHLPLPLLGLDDSRSVVLENARARDSLIQCSHSALGLPVAQAIKPEYAALLPLIEQVMAAPGQTTTEQPAGDFRFHIHRLGNAIQSLGLLVMALPGSPHKEGLNP